MVAFATFKPRIQMATVTFDPHHLGELQIAEPSRNLLLSFDGETPGRLIEATALCIHWDTALELVLLFRRVVGETCWNTLDQCLSTRQELHKLPIILPEDEARSLRPLWLRLHHYETQSRKLQTISPAH